MGGWPEGLGGVTPSVTAFGGASSLFEGAFQRKGYSKHQICRFSWCCRLAASVLVMGTSPLQTPAFIGLYVLIANVYGRVFSLRVVRALMNAATVNAYGSMLTAAAVMLIPAAAFLAVTCWILEHKLNLE